MALSSGIAVLDLNEQPRIVRSLFGDSRLRAALCAGLQAIAAAAVLAEYPQTKLVTPVSYGAPELHGWSVAVTGSTALVGGPYDNWHGDSSGVVHIYNRQGGTWAHALGLTDPDSSAYGYFGWTIRTWEDTCFITAFGFDDGLWHAGSVHFYAQSSGVWTHETRLSNPDPAEEDWFGITLALDADTLAVGVPFSDLMGTDAGAVYVYERTLGEWHQRARLTAPDASTLDHFGSSLGISGDTLMVSARLDDDLGTDSGSAYIFKRSGGFWDFSGKLYASDAMQGAGFGWTTRVSGDTAVVTSRFLPISGDTPGSAYVFKRSYGVWTEQALLRSSEYPAPDNFGNSADLSGNLLVVGAFGDGTAGDHAGAAYVYQHGSGGWTLLTKLVAPDAAPGDWYGWVTATDGETVIIGAPKVDGLAVNAGAAYVVGGFPISSSVECWSLY